MARQTRPGPSENGALKSRVTTCTARPGLQGLELPQIRDRAVLDDSGSVRLGSRLRPRPHITNVPHEIMKFVHELVK